MSVASFSTAVAASSYAGLKSAGCKLFGRMELVSWTMKTVSIKNTVHEDSKKFETLLYAPPLPEEPIAKEIDYMISKGWIHSPEFNQRENSRMPNYYDGRYWTLWKLPMFGCTYSSQAVNEIQECRNAYPNAYICCLAFDNTKQAQ